MDDACAGLSFVSEEVRKHQVPSADEPMGMEQRVCVLALSALRSESRAWCSSFSGLGFCPHRACVSAKGPTQWLRQSQTSRVCHFLLSVLF